MTEKSIPIKYNIAETLSELDEQEQKLIEQAKLAKKGSHAPYSNFNVGAALLMANDKIVQGSNQENAAYPIGLCAERTAISASVSLFPSEKIKTIAIVASSQNMDVPFPVAPCGICRQTLLESESKQKSNIRILLHGNNGTTFIFNSIKELLPLHFDAEYL